MLAKPPDTEAVRSFFASRDRSRAALRQHLSRTVDAVCAANDLSERERQLLVATLDGKELSAYAAEYGVSPETAKEYSKRLRAKTGAPSLHVLGIAVLRRAFGLTEVQALPIVRGA